MATQSSPKSANPVRVPKSVANYANSTEDPSLRSQINTVLIRDGHIARIHDNLLHSLNASPTNWPSLIQSHALAILRSGKCHTFPALMRQVLADIQADTAAVTKYGIVPEGKGSAEGGHSLALPKPVVDEGLRVTKECLETVCEIDR